MRNSILIAMFVACGLFAAVRGGAASAQAPAAQMSSDPAASEETSCDSATPEGAASCSAGGWHATGTCCSTSTGAKERWTLGSSTKCCGPCFTP